MMANKLAFLLFGDQSPDTHDFLADFYRQEKQGILAKAFLDQAGHALRKEVDALSKAERSRVPGFRTLQQLNEKYHGQSLKHPGVDGALLCIAQLAHYINHAEKNYDDVTRHEHTYLVGLCSGLFAASAIALTPSLSSLVPVAVQVVLMAFRTGSYVHALGERLSPSFEQSESWTYVFPGVKESEMSAVLEELHRAKRVPQASRAYVSAVSSSSIAVSGPPATLKALTSSGRLAAKPTSIPVYGPYHAKHLHATAQIDKMLRLEDTTVIDALYGTKPRSAVMSSTTGGWFSARTSSELLRAVVSEILAETLVFNKVLDGCLRCAQKYNNAGQSCLVLPLGPTQSAATLANLLKAQTKLEVTLRKGPPMGAEGIAPGATIGNHGSRGRCKLAVVGMAGRFPDAASHEKLWELLEKGLDVHRVVPADRFDVKTHFDASGKSINTSHTPYGCWIEKPGLFDPRFFNMSPREAFQTDPMQRMALTTAYEALEMSGYVPNRTPSTQLDRIGTFYGQTSDDWREINAAQEVDTYFITGGVRAFGPGRINYHFGFSGPSLNVDTACSSSAAAMQVACTALWARDCDTAVIGGLSCMTNPDIFAGLSRGQFLSKTGPCQTFDNAADGYCRGDGCASVVVKRLEDAEADHDRILAVILGTATNHSADAISITHPHGPTQSILSRSILDEAGVDPLDVDYVEMHGTGTQAGDGTEMTSVTEVFAPADRKRPADRPLYLGAVKANVGHGEAASGVTALVKVLLMLQKNAIPPHVGIKSGSVINKTFPADLSDRNVNIAFHMTPFRRRDGKPRRIFINNFSAAGGNTGLLVEDAPAVPATVADPRSYHVITVTGKSKSAMIHNAERLAAWIEQNPETPLAHIAYSMTARKMQHYWRMSVAVASSDGTAEARQAIRHRLQENFVPVSPEAPKVALLFTGQGSHYAGLGQELYAHHSVFRQSIDEFDLVARIHGFPSFLPLIDGSEPDVSKLSPVVVQLGLSSFEMALSRLWVSWGIKPAVVLGHSLGEYAALYVAGVLSASDAIFLVGTRAMLLTQKCTAGTHAMLAAQGPVATVKEALGAKADEVNVACINGPRETVLSGEATEMAEIARHLTGAGLKCTQLRVPFAFHSAQVEPILDEFEAIARGVQFNAPSVPVISPLLGRLIDREEVAEPIGATYLRRHAREAVDFLGGLVSAQQSGAIDERTVWLEVGPHPVCAGMVKAAFGAATIAVPTLRRNETCYKTLTGSLCALHSAGVNIDFSEYHRDFAASTRLLDLPSYAFDEKNYWLQYTGDWCLTKNRVNSAASSSADAKANGEPAKPKLSTTSVQKVVREEINGDVAVIEIESDLCQEQLRTAVSGHMVNGAPLCPSSLYGDMAMTVCDYAYKLLRPGSDKKMGFNVAQMEVPKTLIFDDKAKRHVLRMTTTLNVATGAGDVVFFTGGGESGKKTPVTQHALCKVYCAPVDEWQDEFDRVAYLIKARIDALQRAEKEGAASKIGRGLAYKLFAALVDYDRRYQGMEEVILDSTTCEATARVRFQTSEQDGNFFFAPYHIDSSCHISGFIINGTDAVDSREQVFVSHGWNSMRFTEIPVAGREYRSYIRMQPAGKGKGKIMAGDAYLFDGDRIIGVTGDIKFQAIPRKVLNLMLPPRGALAAASAAPKAAPAAPPSAAAKKAKGTTTVTMSTIGKINQKLKVKPSSSQSSKSKSSPKARSVVAEVMDILAKEVGCSHDELADNIAFPDLGVDSLMSLTVCGRIREELDLDIDSHAFVEHITIGALKTYLAQFETAGTGAASSRRSPSLESDDSASEEDHDDDDETPDGIESDSDVTTPMDESETESIKGGGGAYSEEPQQLQDTVRNTIAAEMGVEVDEIVAAPDLANLGMDSLMSLSILGTLREKTGLDIPSDLFVSNPSLKAVERALGVGAAPPPAAKKSSSAHHRNSKTTMTSSSSSSSSSSSAALSLAASSAELVSEPSQPQPQAKKHPRIGLEEPAPPKQPRPAHIVDSYPHRKATSVLLSGSHRTAKRQLFMIPDGSGSATSYTEMADVGGDWAVWGLFSPFMKTPEEYHCGVYGMAAKFIDEMRRRQPQGPYSLAGWSAGGVIAYEIVSQLVAAGDAVEHLVFIDAPCPVTIEPLPQGLHAWFASIGLLGDDATANGNAQGKGKPAASKKVPDWLLPHFAASVTALSNYTAEPVPRDKCPRVTAIWCEDGVCHLPDDPRPEPYPKGHALFLLDDRTDFGPNRWDEYLDAGKMTFRHMPGNHFSMMHGELAKQLGGFLKEALL